MEINFLKKLCNSLDGFVRARKFSRGKSENYSLSLCSLNRFHLVQVVQVEGRRRRRIMVRESKICLVKEFLRPMLLKLILP